MKVLKGTVKLRSGRGCATNETEKSKPINTILSQFTESFDLNVAFSPTDQSTKEGAGGDDLREGRTSG